MWAVVVPKCLGAESMISFSSLISSFNYVMRQELRIDYAG